MTTWTTQEKSEGVSAGSFFLLIDSQHYLLIDTTNKLLLQDNTASVTWTNQPKS